ncbi:unnamed protein product [Caenorhabditis auriculariae]|uniref:Uncharacterized protein n=1 Tax=Caenorhabditis auriculariae TaxID=2777116 RepID=A0A8S1GW99_9PELO|nr:unnamed protein product [Caenorhabditis auriculariae]
MVIQLKTVNLPIEKKKMHPPSMGINGFRRSQNYSSQPTLNDYRSQPGHYGSQPNIIPNEKYPPPNYSQVFEPPVVVLRSRKPTTVRSAKEDARLRSQQSPNNVQRVQVVRNRPHSTASYNSIASSGLENIAWRNSTISNGTTDTRRNTYYDEEDSPRVVSFLLPFVSVTTESTIFN